MRAHMHYIRLSVALTHSKAKTGKSQASGELDDELYNKLPVTPRSDIPEQETWKYSKARYVQYLVDLQAVHHAAESGLAEAIAAQPGKLQAGHELLRAVSLHRRLCFVLGYLTSGSISGYAQAALALILTESKFRSACLQINLPIANQFVVLEDRSNACTSASSFLSTSCIFSQEQSGSPGSLSIVTSCVTSLQLMSQQTRSILRECFAALV